jgi:hypothetical protein
MTLAELKKKIDEYNIPDRWYAINEGEKPNALILYKTYANWEFFHVDNEGEKSNHVLFATEEEAYDYLWQQLHRRLQDYNIR